MSKSKRIPAKVWDWLEGKKTYIGAIIIFVAGGLRALEKIDEQTYNTLLTIGGAVSIYGIRNALKKMEE